MDTMSPDQHAYRKCRNPFLFSRLSFWRPEARETREIVTSRTSPRTLLLHIPLTDPLRRIYRLADSRSGTLESPAGRFFDPCVVGSITTAPPPLSLLVCPSISCLCPDYCLSPCCPHSAAVVQSLEHFAHAERSREKWGHYPPAVSTRKSYRYRFTRMKAHPGDIVFVF